MAHPAIPTASFVAILVILPPAFPQNPLLAKQIFVRTSTPYRGRTQCRGKSAKVGSPVRCAALVKAVSGLGWVNRGAADTCQSSSRTAETADGTGLRALSS